MRYATKIAAALVAGAGFLTTSSEAVPPETIMDSRAEGAVQVAADLTIPGVGTIKVNLKSREPDPENQSPLGNLLFQSRTPGNNFPAMNLPFVLISAQNMDRKISLKKSNIEDQNGGFLAAFILSSLSDTRAQVRDQLLLLQRLPFFDNNIGTEDGQDVSLADTVVNFARGGANQPDVSELAPDDPLRDLFDGSIKVTQAKVIGLARGSRGNERYRGRWSVRWKGVWVGGVNDGKQVRGRVTIRFGNTEEPVDQLPGTNEE